MLEGLIVKAVIIGFVCFVGFVFCMCWLNLKHAAEQDLSYLTGRKPPKDFLVQARNRARKAKDGDSSAGASEKPEAENLASELTETTEPKEPTENQQNQNS